MSGFNFNLYVCALPSGRRLIEIVDKAGILRNGNLPGVRLRRSARIDLHRESVEAVVGLQLYRLHLHVLSRVRRIILAERAVLGQRLYNLFRGKFSERRMVRIRSRVQRFVGRRPLGRREELRVPVLLVRRVERGEERLCGVLRIRRLFGGRRGAGDAEKDARQHHQPNSNFFHGNPPFKHPARGFGAPASAIFTDLL